MEPKLEIRGTWKFAWLFFGSLFFPLIWTKVSSREIILTFHRDCWQVEFSSFLLLHPSLTRSFSGVLTSPSISSLVFWDNISDNFAPADPANLGVGHEKEPVPVFLWLPPFRQ